MGLNADQWHILCICLFPVIVIGGISMAVVLGFKEGSKLWFTLGVMFSAGILLSGAIVHSLPHASEAFDGLLGDEEHEEDVVHRLLRRLEDGEDHEEEHDHIFPWAATIFGLSFLFLMCVEAFAERAIDKYVGSKGGNFYGGAHHHEATEGEDEDHDAKPEPIVENSDSSEEADASDPVHTSKEGIVMVRTGTAAIKGNVRRRSSVIQNFLAVDKDGDIPSTYLVTSKRPSVIGVVVSHAPEEGIDDKQTVNPWVSLLLLIVLSIHVLLEGLTLGSDSDPESIRTNFIAIVFHKAPLHLEAVSSPRATGTKGGRKMFYILSLVYASMDIIGIAVGIGLSSAFDEDSYASAILQAMLGGSFLFVSVVELIPGELEKMRAFQLPVFPVMASLLMGYALMTLIGKWE